MSSVAEVLPAAPESDVEDLEQPAEEGARSRRIELLAVTLGALVVAIVLWSFAGFHRLPLWEGWKVFQYFDEGVSGWWLTAETRGLGGGAGRPLEALSHQVGYALTPGTFVGFNVVSMLAFVARGVGGYLLLRELLNGHRAAAVAGALLFAFSPAADGLMIDRVIHVQWAGAFAIGGGAALMIAIRTGRTSLAVLAAVLVSAGLLTYESVLPAVVILPVYALLVTVPRRPAIRMLAIYTGGVVATGIYMLWLRSALPSTYQSGISTLRRPMTDREGLKATIDAVLWNFGGSVVDTLRNVLPMARPDVPTSGWVAAAVMAGIGIAAVAYLSARGRVGAPGTSRELLQLVAFGVVWIGASLVILLPFLPYRYESLRVSSIAQFGTVIVVAALLKVVLVRMRVAGVVLAGVALTATAVVTVQNATLWKSMSDFQSQMVASLVQLTASPDVDTVVIDDHTDRLSHIYEMGPSGLMLGTARNMVLPERPVRVVICDDTGISAVGPAQMGACRITDTEVTLQSLPGYPDEPLVLAREEVLVLDLFAGDQPQLRPRDDVRETPVSELPDRVRDALPCWSGEPCADDAVAADLPTAPVLENFDRAVTYEDVPPRGAPVEDLGPIQVNGISWRWTTSEDSAIYADLDRGRYVIRARVLSSSVAADELGDLRLSLNGQELRTTVRPDGPDGLVLEAEGTVGRGSPRADRVGIAGPVTQEAEHPENGLGMAVDWMSVDPAP